MWVSCSATVEALPYPTIVWGWFPVAPVEDLVVSMIGTDTLLSPEIHTLPTILLTAEAMPIASVSVVTVEETENPSRASI